MRIALVLFSLLAAACIGEREPVVAKSSLRPDVVKRGEMPVAVRGLGVVQPDGSAAIQIHSAETGAIQPGQSVSLKAENAEAEGKVTRIHSGTDSVIVSVDIASHSLKPGTKVDGTIHIATLEDVVYVGRPVFGQANSESTLFKLDPDGRYANRVKVQFGQSSLNLMQVRAGLQPGDRVVLSDMTAYSVYDRIRLQ